MPSTAARDAARLRARVAELERRLAEAQAVGLRSNAAKREALRNQAVAYLASLATGRALKPLAIEISAELSRYETTTWLQKDRDESPSKTAVSAKRYALFEVLKFNFGKGLGYRTIMKIIEKDRTLSSLAGAKLSHHLHQNSATMPMVDETGAD